MPLQPEWVRLAPAPLLYLEKIGPFQRTAPEAWREFMPLLMRTTPPLFLVGAGLSLIDNSKQGDAAYVYRAGMFLKEMPASAPEGLKLAMHEGGAFASFLLSGSYNQLPEAFPLAIEAVVKSHTRIRETFFIEKYLNDPSKTPEADLKTQILVPVERDV